MTKINLSLSTKIFVVVDEKTLIVAERCKRGGYLGADRGTVEIQLGVGEDVVQIDRQSFGVQPVRLLRLATFKCRVAFFFLLYQLLGPL